SFYDKEGIPYRFSGTAIDVTERRQLDEQTRFLAQASVVLSSSLDYETTLRQAAGLIVPRFACWCMINLLDKEGVMHRVAVVHADPEKFELAQRLLNLPIDPEAPGGVSKTVRER